MVLPEEVAAWILAETVRRRASLRDVASEYFSRNPGREYMKPLVRVLTLGVARNYILLDHVLATLGYGPPSHSTRWMLARIAAYEALGCRLKPSRLRALAEKTGLRAEDLERIKCSEPREYVKGLSGVEKLRILYSFPRWAIEELLQARTPNLPQLLAALNRDPIRWLRVKPGVDMEALARSLEKQGVTIIPDRDLPDMARIVHGASVATRTREYREGLYVLQDKASALVSWVASPRGRVLVDPTAGAAVKASHAAWLGASYVVAGELKQGRLGEARRLLARLRLRHHVDLVVADARAPFYRRADVVVVDPPCSDLGRLQYEPEVKMWLTRGDVKYFRRLQLSMAEAAVEQLPPGGTLVYSVCTLTWSETVWVMRRLLERHPDLAPGEQEPFLGARPPRLPWAQWMLPHLHRTQGFFIAKLVKQ